MKRVHESVARLRAKVHAGEPLSALEHEPWYGTSSSSAGKRRKKKRKRKLPKAPLPRCGRPCDLQRQVPAVPVVQTDLIPQVQFLGKVVAPVLCNDRCVVRWCCKLWLSRSCSPSKVVDIPFLSQRQIPVVQFRRSMPLLCRSCSMPVVVCDRCSWFRPCRKPWKCRSCSSCMVVDVTATRSDEFPAVREVPQTRSLTGCSSADEGCFRCIFQLFSHSVRMDVSAHFSALDDEEFFVVEGSGWRGRRESDSQVFCLFTDGYG